MSLRCPRPKNVEISSPRIIVLSAIMVVGCALPSLVSTKMFLRQQRDVGEIVGEHPSYGVRRPGTEAHEARVGAGGVGLGADEISSLSLSNSHSTGEENLLTSAALVSTASERIPSLNEGHADSSHHNDVSVGSGSNPMNPLPLTESTSVSMQGHEDPANSSERQSGAVHETRPYNIENALLTTQGFHHTLFFFVYDSASDEFIIIHTVPQCSNACARVFRAAGVVAYALRKNFPERFRRGESDDLVFMLSTGDAPRIKQHCLLSDVDHCGSSAFAPILQFGSVFASAAILPSMVAMPLPVRPHLTCFGDWQLKHANGNAQQVGALRAGSRALFHVERIHGGSSVCQDLQPRIDFSTTSATSGLVFGKELGLLGGSGDDGVGDADAGDYWDRLIPQVVWRGTDFSFLHALFPSMRAPRYELDIAPKLEDQSSLPKDLGSSLEQNFDHKRWAIETLWNMGNEELLPRWRGVLLTSEAELEADEFTARTNPPQPKLPWADMKFAAFSANGEILPASENPEYQQLRQFGIDAAGKFLNMTEHARYRYHIDIGGGGGTTWTGTISKLALPGLLFHHVTPAKDWFHDLLVPWSHYVPVKQDLSDLREKFEWAESHPEDARRIAEEATRLVRWMGSDEGFARLYEDHLLSPLRGVIGAFLPSPPKNEGRSVMDVITERGEQGEGFTIVGRCSGHLGNSCEKLV